MSDSKDKYKTKIAVQNDSVFVVGSSSASYNPELDRIVVKKGDISMKDFGFDHVPQTPEENLIFIHERQHQINTKKGAYTHTMSLSEYYNRNVHDEVTALIAEKLEIRRQYKELKTPKEREEFLKKYANNEEHAEYIEAIKSGKVNPNSKSSKDFNKEMALIKDSSIRYRADPNDDGYKEQWTSVAMRDLAKNGNAKPNPEGFAEDVRKMYVIGGFDFNTVGNQNLMLIENQNITAADNMLAQNADPEKLLRFMREKEGPYAIAEKLDITGLSKEQAQKVILTAIVTQYNADNIAEDLCLNEEPKMNFDNEEYSSMAQYLRKQIAPYMDLKQDIWEKNNMLTKDGDEEKFKRLMQQAQTVTLDPQSWYNLMGSMIRRDKYDLDEVEARVAKYQGKTININDVVTNMDEFALPFDKVSLEETLKQKAKEEADDATFWEEYYKKNPNAQKRRLSDPYDIEITNMESSLLKDELNKRKENEKKENKVEPLYSNPIKTYMPIGDGRMMETKTPEFNKAELLTIKNKDGSTTEVATIDGKKHGAEFTRDKDGNIVSCKIYDHGKELNLNNKNNKFSVEAGEKDGLTYTYITLNGKKFGAEIITDPKNGKTKAAFYDQGGIRLAGSPNANITQKTQDAPDNNIKEALTAQRGGTPQNPKAISSSLRFNTRVDKHPTTPPDAVRGKSAPTQTNNNDTLIRHQKTQNSR